MRRSSTAVGFLDLEDLQASLPDQLPGGQRAYVAMVLAQETDYVLLDEPQQPDIAASMMTMLETPPASFHAPSSSSCMTSTLRRAASQIW